MCGIAGYIGNQENYPNKRNLKLCLSQMYNRGPNSKGIYLNELGKFKFVFLHTRLSIIGLGKHSNQPMEDEKGVISFNGEIYNYIELKKICEKKGIKFKTNSDTEVLLKLLNLYKEKAIKFLDGMWAFSYYDKVNKKIILSRDKFGEKPLYFIKKKNFFIYASSVKYLNTLLKKKITFNKKKIFRHLTYGFKEFGYNQDTIFNNIKILKPGSCLIIDKNFPDTRKINWNFTFQETKKISYNDAVKQIKTKIINIFKKRFRSDVPLSLLLSGGIDSNAILSLANKLGIKINSYSFQSNSKNYNENKLILENVKKSNSVHKFIKIPSKNNLNRLRKIIRYQFLPLPTSTAFAHSLICNKIKANNFKVLLSGAGGDEIFGGYYYHYLCFLHSMKKKRNFKNIYNLWKMKISYFIKSPYLKKFEKFDKLITKNKHRSTIHTIYEDSEIKKYLKKSENKFQIKKYSKDFFKNTLLQDMFHNHLPQQLEIADSISMFDSIEARSPFLSEELLKSVISLPKEYLFEHGTPKALLRDAVKEFIPRKIYKNLNKVGFGCPFDEIFNKDDKKEIEELIISSNFINNFIKKNKVINLLKSNKKKHSESKFLFSVLNIVLISNIIHQRIY